MTTIDNNWIELPNKFKGVTVLRKYTGHINKINPDTNEVLRCDVFYAQRELYPDGSVIKTEEKFYSLIDLPYTELMEGDVLKFMDPLPVLSGFIQSLGQPYIVDAARETLENDVILPANSENGYPLRRDTREKFIKEEPIEE